MMKMNNKEYVSEADVETKYVYAILLREILNFSSDRINFHVPIKITQGRKTETKEADVVINDEKGDSFIVIDSKSPTEKLENYFDQIDSYAFKLEAPISILTNYYRMIVRIYLAGNKKETILDEEIESLINNDYNHLGGKTIE